MDPTDIELSNKYSEQQVRLSLVFAEIDRLLKNRTEAEYLAGKKSKVIYCLGATIVILAVVISVLLYLLFG